MHRITRARAAVLAVALTALLAVGAVAVAAIPDSSGAINACYGSSGKLRAVDGPLDCSGAETSIALGGPTYGSRTRTPTSQRSTRPPRPSDG